MDLRASISLSSCNARSTAPQVKKKTAIEAEDFDLVKTLKLRIDKLKIPPPPPPPPKLKGRRGRVPPPPPPPPPPLTDEERHAKRVRTLGLGRFVVSEIEAPNLLENMV
jgi:hypothetical protein